LNVVECREVGTGQGKGLKWTLLTQRNLSMEIGHMVSKFKVYSGWQRLSFWV